MIGTKNMFNVTVSYCACINSRTRPGPQRHQVLRKKIGQEMSGMMNHKDFRGLGITITSKSCLPCLDHCPDAPGSPTSQSQRLIKGYGQFIHLDSGHKGKSTTKLACLRVSESLWLAKILLEIAFVCPIFWTISPYFDSQNHVEFRSINTFGRNVFIQ